MKKGSLSGTSGKKDIESYGLPSFHTPCDSPTPYLYRPLWNAGRTERLETFVENFLFNKNNQVWTWLDNNKKAMKKDSNAERKQKGFRSSFFFTSGLHFKEISEAPPAFPSYEMRAAMKCGGACYGKNRKWKEKEKSFGYNSIGATANVLDSGRLHLYQNKVLWAGFRKQGVA